MNKKKLSISIDKGLTKSEKLAYLCYFTGWMSVGEANSLYISYKGRGSRVIGKCTKWLYNSGYLKKINIIKDHDRRSRKRKNTENIGRETKKHKLSLPVFIYRATMKPLYDYSQYVLETPFTMDEKYFIDKIYEYWSDLHSISYNSEGQVKGILDVLSSVKSKKRIPGKPDTRFDDLFVQVNMIYFLIKNKIESSSVNNRLFNRINVNKLLLLHVKRLLRFSDQIYHEVKGTSIFSRDSFVEKLYSKINKISDIVDYQDYLVNSVLGVMDEDILKGASHESFFKHKSGRSGQQRHFRKKDKKLSRDLMKMHKEIGKKSN